MSSFSRTLLILSIALLPNLAGGATLFGARYDQSHWESRLDGGVCYLSHAIPRFGLALFSQDTSGRLSLSVSADRPPSEEGRASLISRSPNWKPALARRLDAVRLRADTGLMWFSHYNAQRIIAELEQGQEAVVRFEGWWGEGVTELALSPINFRAALRTHLQCLAGLPRVAETGAGPTDLALPRYHQISTEALPHADDADVTQAQEPSAVYFASDNAGLDRPAMDILRQFAAGLEADPAASAVISTGHTDPRGGSDYNRRLGERRARNVRAYLLELGLEPQRIQVETLGELAPASPATDSYGLAENRRVVLESRR